jgi:hypothetical protein
MTEKIAPPSEKSKEEDLFDTATELFEKAIDKLSQNTTFRDGIVKRYLHLDSSLPFGRIPFEGKDGKYTVMVNFFSSIEKWIDLSKLNEDLSEKEHFCVCLNYHPTRRSKWFATIRYQDLSDIDKNLIFNEEAASKFREVLEKI